MNTIQIMVILLAVLETAPVAALVAALAVVAQVLIHRRYQQLLRDQLDAANTTIAGLQADLCKARIDPVTGLPTRHVAEQQLTASNGTTKTVALIDVNGMHEFNLDHGHDMGDWLLAQLAQRLSGVLGPGDLAARLGGDEFAVISNHHPATLARLLFTVLGQPLREGDDGFPATAGICPVDRGNARRALSCADAAMFTAKRRGSRIEVYDPVRDGPPSTDTVRPRVRLRDRSPTSASSHPPPPVKGQHTP